MALSRFFRYARTRYQIKLTRETPSNKPPWTTDPILQKYRFCNIFREDDRVTQWFRENVRDRYRDRGCVVAATIIFRWFNRIETGQVLRAHGLLTKWNPKIAKDVLKDLHPLVTGAYMIKTPAKMKKLEGLCWCIDNVWSQRHYLEEVITHASTLRGAHTELLRFPYLGPFMAYEIVTDLRHTALLEDAKDINSWASAGPGAARGLGRILTGDVGQFNYSSKPDREIMERSMGNLLVRSRHERFWPKRWPRWEMREVEHTLCEFDKYERARLGQGAPKQRFTPCS